MIDAVQVEEQIVAENSKFVIDYEKIIFHVSVLKKILAPEGSLKETRNSMMWMLRELIKPTIHSLRIEAMSHCNGQLHRSLFKMKEVWIELGGLTEEFESI